MMGSFTCRHVVIDEDPNYGVVVAYKTINLDESILHIVLHYSPVESFLVVMHLASFNVYLRWATGKDKGHCRLRKESMQKICNLNVSVRYTDYHSGKRLETSPFDQFNIMNFLGLFISIN